jgi:hypothetical protein
MKAHFELRVTASLRGMWFFLFRRFLHGGGERLFVVWPELAGRV